MNTLIIINTIFILYILVKPYISFYQIKVEKTFWGKKPYGFTLTKWKYPVGVIPNSGTCVFYFNWRAKPKDDFKKRKY